MKLRRELKDCALLALLGLAACTGRIDRGGAQAGASGAGSGAPGGSGSGGVGAVVTGTGGTAAPVCAPGASFAQARLTLLSDQQYRNVVHDAFGVTFPATVDVTSPPSGSGAYSFNENAELETTTVQAYQRAADQVASLLTATPLAPCAVGAVDATCIEAYLRTTLPLAWRRPVTDAEIAGLLSIFDAAATDGQTRQVQLTIEAALLHPAFLYRTEIGTNAATATSKITLTPYELASAVSFALLNSSPDAALFAVAKDGSLTRPDVLAAQVTRLMALPATRANLMKKVSYYLDFETLPFTQKDATAYPGFAALQGTLYQSAQLFLNDIMWSGHFGDLFTSRTIYANEAMAAAYGLPAVTGTALQAISTTGDAYGAGLLTQPALLAASNKNAIGDDVIHRGLWVYYNLLCAPVLPPPPANANTIAATITGSTRQQATTRDTTCGAACHGRFDPFGLATLSYDGIGRYRTTDPTTTPPGGPEDDSATVIPGVLAGAGTSPVMIAGASDVAHLFGQGRQVSDCAADSLATYTLDHSPDAQGSCDLQTIKDRFQQSGSFPDLFSSILTSPAFLTRDP
jgi:uncharacterized protein DUF1592/uncharacterized protein DUF1588/uncharacterized protein DUF1595/uncharacterized protein DUF1587